MAASTSMTGLTTWRTPKGSTSLRQMAAVTPSGTAMTTAPSVTSALPKKMARAPKAGVGS